VTFATPHLGIYKPSSNPFSRIFNWASTYLLSHSGEQMRLVDNYRNGRPLLEIMSSPGKVAVSDHIKYIYMLELTGLLLLSTEHEFLKHMARFERRLIYANAINDRSVPFWTAAFEDTHYFSKIKTMEM
jgi:hypothetical protein